jgi:3',5'-cyclic AMP phosphodiesterase CpdA
MEKKWNRRDFVTLLGLGGVVFASGLTGCGEGARAPVPVSPTAASGRRARDDFFFLQLSDTHWGFKGPPNPDADVTLKRTIATINASSQKPDFIVFTGDLTHTTDDAAERRARMAQLKEIVAGLDTKTIYFIPGEHDASLDRGEAYREAFGPTHYAFDHKGIHFVALDNVSDPTGSIGEEQIAWLEKDLGAVAPDVPLVVFAHRPLFSLYPQWDWDTKDGEKVIAVLSRRHYMTGHIAHHSARSLIFPLPAPGSAPKRAPVPWDPAAPYRGLGYRSVETGPEPYAISELPVVARIA